VTTNRPWEIDENLVRLLMRRIYIPLPTLKDREEIMKIHLNDLELEPHVDLSNISARCDGFSGSDLVCLCREAYYMPLRRKL
jgi:SpoVK/Ycf46/Vps4 family AAA+-type ATPase